MLSELIRDHCWNINQHSELKLCVIYEKCGSTLDYSAIITWFSFPELFPFPFPCRLFPPTWLFEWLDPWFLDHSGPMVTLLLLTWGFESNENLIETPFWGFLPPIWVGVKLEQRLFVQVCRDYQSCFISFFWKDFSLGNGSHSCSNFRFGKRCTLRTFPLFYRRRKYIFWEKMTKCCYWLLLEHFQYFWSAFVTFISTQHVTKMHRHFLCQHHFSLWKNFKKWRSWTYIKKYDILLYYQLVCETPNSKINSVQWSNHKWARDGWGRSTIQKPFIKIS